MPRIAVIILAAVVVVVAATAGRYMMSDDSGAKTTQRGRATIGGPFTLTDHTGKRVTDKDFHGKYILVYFGYTFCPDVCPTSLSIVAEAMDQLDEDELAKLVPIFISVDHERDTPEVLASYVPHFHEKMVGMTGSADELKAVSRAYKAYYAKVNVDDPDGNYTMDHSSITYLMGPDGNFVLHFNHNTDPNVMAERLKGVL